MENKEIKLYGGKVKIYFNEARHIFSDSNGVRIDGVTSATGKLDKSAPLMWWACKMMGIYILDKWNDKIKTVSQLNELVEQSKKRYRTVKQEAADIGTEIHKYAEEWIKGKKPKMPEDEMARNGVIAFLKWIKENRKIKITESERFVYSRKYNFAGIMDWEGIDDGELIIGDFKSSKGIYNEMLYQLSGYWLAREEETGKKYSKGYIVQFGKETGEFNVKEISRAEHLKNKVAFLSLLKVKRREDELK